MGSYTAPMMQVEEDMVRFSAFSPNQTKPSLYSPSILYQTLIEKPWDKSVFWAPSSEMYLRGDQLESDKGLEILGQLESTFKRYEAASQALSAAEAEALGFPEEFIRTLKTPAT